MRKMKLILEYLSMIHQHLFARLARTLVLRTGPAPCSNKHGACGLRQAVLALLVVALALAPGAWGAAMPNSGVS